MACIQSPTSPKEESTAGRNQVRRSEHFKLAVPVTLEKILKQQKGDGYKRYLAMQELQRRVRKQEFDEELRQDELRKNKRLADSQHSTEELSDYEVEPEDLYPPSKHK